MAEEPRRGPPVVEIVLPTYITKPAEDEKFYPSEVKAVAEKVSYRGIIYLLYAALQKSLVLLCSGTRSYPPGVIVLVMLYCCVCRVIQMIVTTTSYSSCTALKP